MKKIITVILLLALILAITGEKSQAEEIENVWSNTVNYKNRGGYTDSQLVDREFFSLIVGVSDDYLVLPLYDLQNNISAYVIQYYNEGVPYSYVVINTRTISQCKRAEKDNPEL